MSSPHDRRNPPPPNPPPRPSNPPPPNRSDGRRSTWPSICCGVSPVTSAAPSSTSCVSSSASRHSRRRSCRRCTACRRSSMPTPNWRRCTRWNRRRSRERVDTRRVVAEHTWLRRRTRDADIVHHGGGTTPSVGRRPDRAHDPRPSVPHTSGVPHLDQAAVPRTHDPEIGRARCRRRRSDRVRPLHRHRRLRRRTGPRHRRAARGRVVARRGRTLCLRSPPGLRARCGTDDRLSGDHPPAQEPPLPPAS